MATWRLVSAKRAKGPYYVLETGRGRDRRGLTLGYVDDEAAERALKAVRAEEDAETIGRVLRLYARSREDAVRYLCGDPEVAKQVGEPEPDYGGMRLRDYYEQVFAPWRREANPGSWASEERHFRLMLAKIGHVRLRALDEFVFADYLDALRVTRGKRAGLPASGNTKRLHRAALQALLKRAYRCKHIERMPNLATFRIAGATKAVRKKPEPLSLEEVLALLDAAPDQRRRAMWAVGVGQGLRPSELIAVHWEDVDLEASTLAVRGTKTEASADVIPLTPLARRELRALWEERGRPGEGLVFPSSTTGKMYADSSGYRGALKADLKRAGIGRHVYPYLLRDSFATLAWALGLDKDVARRVLRHTDEAMLNRVYCRPRPEDLVRAVAGFDFR